MPVTSTEHTVLTRSQWCEREQAHASRVDELTRAHRERVSGQIPHPVEDFLFTYYSLRPGQLRRWYPGAGIALADAPERVDWRFHRMLDLSSTGAPCAAVAVDVDAFRQARGSLLAFTARLLSATSAAPAQFGCFGLHEWAMVFGQDAEQRRHSGRALRLGQDGTDDVVRAHQIRCTHYDAFRFFTPPARPRNLLQPNLDSRPDLEQPGCLHASMDLYKWAYKLLPAVPSELLVDCFVLARQIRELDMRASPYDLADLGYPPVRIETVAGKAEYVAAQRDFAAKAQVLRRRLSDVVTALLP